LASGRELQVFVRIARGLPPSITAAELCVSVNTVSTYRSRILEKLGLASNAEMAVYALRNHRLDRAIQ
jgi:DNA-binding NarL/FixJ family response regulator